MIGARDLFSEGQLRGEPRAHHRLARAVAAHGGGDLTYIYMVGRLATVPANGDLDIPIHTLRYGDRAHWLGAYWTAPGRYTLDVAFVTVIEDQRNAPIRLRAAPITLEVR